LYGEEEEEEEDRPRRALNYKLLDCYEPLWDRRKGHEVGTKCVK